MPRAPKQCGRDGCPVLVVARSYCPDHTPQAWAGAGRGSTRAWRRLADQVLEKEPRCRDCGGIATEAGHIVARSRGGRDTRANLKGQCRPCNLAQLAADRAAPHAP